MKHLLNTLFITSDDLYLGLDGENVAVYRDKEIIHRQPLLQLQNIVTFAYSGASPALMGKCSELGIGLAFFSQSGRFLARVSGENNGNVLLRRTQYRTADDEKLSCAAAGSMVFGKIYNCRSVIERTKRDHGMRVDTAKLTNASDTLKSMLATVNNEESLENLRGLEGIAAVAYFSVFDEMIIGDKEHFFYHSRSRRPPLDRVNAMMSFAYSLLAHDCANALQSAGLDPYVGFMHRDRPGRMSLALDLMEELRPCIADRYVLTLINNRMIKDDQFVFQESGAVLMTDDARKTFINGWQERKKESIIHPFLKEKLEWGMVPYIQAALMARYLRGDIDEYPPFLNK